MTETRTITRLLIANRGEIARRIMRTAKQRGITCVAVFSDPDADALFVTEADYAVALGGSTSAESYLDAEKVLAAAKALNCDALHPGYGFLSENAAFAAAVTDAGLVWVGPTPQSIAAMAEKVPAKRLVAAAGVPLVPGTELDAEVAPAELVSAGADVGYPLMVKASSGGGGKGMRVVTDADDLVAAVAAARREAASAFGDPTVFLERYLPAARHIEVQVFGDQHGNVGHLFERECSIQRRHQKVVEEAPAAHLADQVRDGLHAAAVAAAKAIDYVGAGTVEFLVDGEDYYFLEMNTRLQVEHPVTEEVAGVDLVAWQLDVAQGRPLPQLPAEPRGHAIEVRLYAEDARNDDLPSTGELSVVEFDDPRIRVDTGVADGSQVSPFYDPMLAKVIAHGPTREIAAARLAAGLRGARIHGVTTNREMLVAIIESPAFAEDVTTTAFLSEHPEVRQAWPAAATLRAHALAAVAVLLRQAGRGLADVGNGATVPPAWRNVVRPGGISVSLAGEYASRLDGEAISVHRLTRRRRAGEAGGPTDARGFDWGLAAAADVAGTQAGDGIQWFAGTSVEVGPTGDAATVIDHDGVRTHARVAVHRCTDSTPGPSSDTDYVIWVDDPREHSVWQVPSRYPDVDTAGGGSGPSAPVPGTIAAVMVAPGDAVVAGDTVVILEAMKMEHRITADADGVVDQVLVAVGDSVEAHQVVVRLTTGEDAE